MEAIIGLIILILLNLISFAVPSLLAAWLFTLTTSISLSQALWLSLGVILVIRYVIQNVTDIPGKSEMSFLQGLVSVVGAFIVLLLAGVFARLLRAAFAVDLTMFEATALFATSLTAGLFFMMRSGTVAFPGWMMMPDFDFEDDEDEEEYIEIEPAPYRSKRRSSRRTTGKGWTN